MSIIVTALFFSMFYLMVIILEIYRENNKKDNYFHNSIFDLSNSRGVNYNDLKKIRLFLVLLFLICIIFSTIIVS